MKKKLVVFSGAGISAESGLKTFRDHDGLWENYSIYEVATPEAWAANPALVQRFYNERRKQILDAQPNKAHAVIAQLESDYDVAVITQNIDDLHERAGSTNVLHLHGLITKSQSSFNPNLVYPIHGWELKMGEKCALGSQLRPHVVWFGEEVPKMDEAKYMVANADVFVVIGSSLQVYPAASLVYVVNPSAQKFIIDPKAGEIEGFTAICDTAVSGLPKLVKLLT